MVTAFKLPLNAVNIRLQFRVPQQHDHQVILKSVFAACDHSAPPTLAFVSGSFCKLQGIRVASKNLAACLFAVVVYYYYVFFGFSPGSRSRFIRSASAALAALYLTLGSLMAGNRILMDFVISSSTTALATGKAIAMAKNFTFLWSTLFLYFRERFLCHLLGKSRVLCY